MFRIRQWIKMLLQNVLLPVVYGWYRRKPVQPGRILMADAHHDEMPFSMRRVWEELKNAGMSRNCSLRIFHTCHSGRWLHF